jgi:hypothetical protein
MRGVGVLEVVLVELGVKVAVLVTLLVLVMVLLPVGVKDGVPLALEETVDVLLELGVTVGVAVAVQDTALVVAPSKHEEGQPQGEHVGAPPAEKVPARQLAQDCEPATLYLPGPQLVHVALFMMLNDPAGHIVGATAPVGHANPAGHTV